MKAKEFVELWEKKLGLQHEEGWYKEDTKNRYSILLEQVPRDPDLKILDVGAGKGYLSLFLKKWCRCEVHALDLRSYDEWEVLKKEGIRVEECDVERERFPFENETFDCVVCSEVLEHLLHSPSHMLSEIRRVLRRGGVLVLSTPNAVRLEVRLKVLLGKELCHYRSFYASPPSDRHNKEYTLSEVRELLSEHGFRVERIFCRNTTSWRAIRSSPSRRLLVGLLLAATHLWPTFKELIFVKARKRTWSRRGEGVC